ncbi:DNA alkylation repair enzyme [hydrothermal vent metagenome]|uniref:DNA alkylation repair enzyme n=1 Tax=hydrothermal vent metagenome TaxID=652676 RepID=A0A3B1CKP7_9ZZZZ
MAEALKNSYNEKFFKTLSAALKTAYPKFGSGLFHKLIFDDEWETRELKQRMRHITLCLKETLPNSYRKSLEILLQTAPEFSGFEPMFFPDFVEVYGMDDWEISIAALEEFTKYSSSEFAVRPFILKDSAKMMKQMQKWTSHDNHHVRRLSSEGCRPRLPWAMALPEFKKKPGPVLAVLDKLKNDSHEYVRRSVANNINDISKDNPELIFNVVKKWHGQNRKTDWIAKHGLRTLLKNGDKKALLMFGFAATPAVVAGKLKTNKRSIKIGEHLGFSFELLVKSAKRQKIRLEYAIYYLKANGSLSKKVFKISENEYEKGNKTFTVRRSFKNMTTRKHYPGCHKLTIIVNGNETQAVTFTLKS